MNTEDADNPFKWCIFVGPCIIGLFFALCLVDVSLAVFTVYETADPDGQIQIEKKNLSFRLIADICCCTYRLFVIIICWRFWKGFLFGTVSQKHIDEHGINDLNLRKMVGIERSATRLSRCQQYMYLCSELELGQFTTIAAVFCAVHQLYSAVLLFIAVWGDGDESDDETPNERVDFKYNALVSGIEHVLGMFSIALPGICFNQFLHYSALNRIEVPNRDDRMCFVFVVNL